ncbi:dipeptide epimerase [Alkalihalophilus lindianensis]|uniref:Dipeptide epimerase n=1 Tax=Alkalihalophilus lindianensis TaxID=1630542 RepID=A0ABU3X9L5_9BACI|nr:dipeptide epimerase [Alkalihalophilus lindianensis]MDV2684567.1 dipeptide epimerase [Alkalihalophilus lindianensis]
MKITSVSIYLIQLPLKEPFIVSYHTYSSMPAIIVKIETDCGLVGYGEGVADEHVTGESARSTVQVIKHHLASAIIGEDPFKIEKIHALMDETIYGVPTAKAAIDIACYDLIGKAVNQPVYNFLGGRYHERFSLAHVLSIKPPHEMADEAEQVVAMGYRALKMKVGTDPLTDVERVKSVRRRVGSDILIRIDANQGWMSCSEALLVINKIQDCQVDWIEQPVLADDIDALREVKQKTSVAIMVDEGVKGTREMREVSLKRAADKVNIKLMKCGGIYPAMKLVHQAEMIGMTCQIGSMVESSIGSAAGFHVAFSKKAITSVELTGPLKFSKDVGNLVYDIPYIRLNELPGLGIQIDENVLQELTEEKVVISKKS